MDAFLAMFWLIGQILSVVALGVGLVLSVLYWACVTPFRGLYPRKTSPSMRRSPAIAWQAKPS